MTGKWNYLPLTSEQKRICGEFEQKYPNCPAISRLLVLRNLRSLKDVRDFFYPVIKQLHDPFLLKDMDKAVARLNHALGAKEKIMIYGDYDVDGTTAVALVYRYLQNFYSNLIYYIPTRQDEGYGISLQSIDYAKSVGVSLIIVLDCGIKAIEEITYAKSLGIDFIVCDHHVPDDVLPPAAAILNPKQPADNYPFKGLSGCGVGFKFMQAFAQSNGTEEIHKLEPLLDLVAVSVIADLVPLIGENRVFTLYGLKYLNAGKNLGLKHVIRNCHLAEREIDISHITFKIAPRLNAPGRMQSGMDTVALLVTKDPVQAEKLAARIEQFNEQRKQLDKQITTEAGEIVAAHRDDLGARKPIVIYDPAWHKGIVGIVAARMAELYLKPAVVLTDDGNGFATGSARSVHNFDVYQAVRSCRHLLKNYGGHTNAVGLTLPIENIDAFRADFTEYVEAHITDEQIVRSVNVDAQVTLAEINTEFLRYLRHFSPYGVDNPKPVFVAHNVKCTDAKLVGKNSQHIRVSITDGTTQAPLHAIAFNLAKRFNEIKDGQPFDICFTIGSAMAHHTDQRNKPPQLLIHDIHTYL